jgi:hypothetical protein
VILGAGVGAALAAMNSGGGGVSAADESGIWSMTPGEFASEILRAERPGGRSNIDGIVIHPPAADPGGKPTVTAVTMTRWRYDPRAGAWTPARYSVLFGPPPSFGANDPPSARGESGGDALDFLRAASAARPSLTYRYAWWEETRWCYALWMGGSIVVIGGIWPVVVSGGRRGGGCPADEYDLDHFGHPADQRERIRPDTEISQVDRERLEVQCALLERTLAGDLGASATTPPADPVAPSIPELTGGPVVPAATEEPDDAKHYRGEFYPVAAPDETPRNNTPC